MILLSHPTANQNVRQAALALAEASLLSEFWTCINWREDGVLDKYLPIPDRVRQQLRRRSFALELQPFLRTLPWREWGRLISGQLGLRWTIRNEEGPLSMDAVYFSFDRRVAQRLRDGGNLKAVHAYDNAALESFRAAKERGLRCIYEHPIVYWREVRKLQQEEAELHPEWAPTLGALRDSDEKLARKDAELALADVVITASKFSKQSLAQVPGLKASIQVIPYGAPSSNDRDPSESGGQKLRVLFVGALSQAKGLGYLLQAVNKLRDQVQFTMIGHRVSATVPTGSAMSGHRWIPALPHDQLLAEMSTHDVLVFPSLHEGFGLVMAEAMAQGLAVIATPHTAAPDIMTDGVEGFIVPIRSAEAIEEKLALLLADRDRLAGMKSAARRKAQTLSWANYRRQLASVARGMVE